MINKYNFFEHGKVCPVCSNKLSLYLSISNVGTFKCNNNFVKNKKNKLNFYPLKDNFFTLHNGILKSDFIKIHLLNDKDFSFTLSSESLFRVIERETLHFFYLCNLNSFVCKNSYYNGINNYEIQSYLSCYYKGSNILSFKYDGLKHTLTLDQDEALSIEAFSVSSNDESKRFCLVYDTSDNKTTLYVIDSTTSKDFSSSVELMDHYPDFSNKEKLIKRFESWILMS